jgi:hypothetical protein
MSSLPHLYELALAEAEVRDLQYNNLCEMLLEEGDSRTDDMSIVSCKSASGTRVLEGLKGFGAVEVAWFPERRYKQVVDPTRILWPPRDPAA